MWFCETCKIEMTPKLARLNPRHQCPAGRRSRGVGDVVARATRAVGVKPCAPCKQRQQALNFLLPAGSDAADVYQLLHTQPRDISPDCAIVTAADGKIFAHLQLLLASIAATNNAPIYVIDLGLTKLQLRWVRRLAHVLPRPELSVTSGDGWQTFNKIHYIDLVPVRYRLWLDADCVVTESLNKAFGLIKRRPLICRDDIAHRFVNDPASILRNAAPLDRGRVPSISAGGVGFDAVRDRDLLDAWRANVARASTDDVFKKALAFFDQGALLLALENLGFDASALSDPAIYNSGEGVRDRVPAVLLRRLLVTRASVLHYAGVGKLELSASNKRLKPSAPNADLEFFACAHNSATAENVPSKSWLQTVRLDQLDSPPRYAESRFFLDDDCLRGASPWVGVGSWQWNKKWLASVRLEHVNRVTRRPGVVYCPLIARPDWATDADRHHPKMSELVRAIAARFPGEYTTGAAGPLCNSFICERGVWRAFVSFFRRVLYFLNATYGDAWPFDVGEFDATRKPAYLLERVATGWFPARGLEVVQI